MRTCPVCNTDYRSAKSLFCQNCGEARPIAKPNGCTNQHCENHGVDLGEASLYCDLCGADTIIGKKIKNMI